MKLSITAGTAILLTLTCCNSSDEISNSSTPTAEEFVPISGVGTIEGYTGYFSAALPPGGNSAYPSGYLVGNHHWLTDSPRVAYWGLFLQGKDSVMRNAVYVRASGRWITRPFSKQEVYIDMIVDSLEVVKRKGGQAE